MDRYINCIAHKSSDGNLLIGDKETALVDCGMAFCAAETIQMVKNALKGRPLDYIFFTHTHYDHIGALPFFREEWPGLRTVISALGAAALLKDTPRLVIRELSLTASLAYTGSPAGVFSDDVYTSSFQGDIIVEDGGSVSLGDLTVKVLETPGHTRDSISFFVPELDLLIMNESPGVLMPDGSVMPCFLSSSAGVINSINKSKQISHRHLSLPHRGYINNDEAEGFFDKALSSNLACRSFILEMKNRGLSDGEMLDSFFRQYSTEELLKYQPREAFFINARAMISCVLREDINHQSQTMERKA